MNNVNVCFQNLSKWAYIRGGGGGVGAYVRRGSYSVSYLRSAYSGVGGYMGGVLTGFYGTHL